MLWNYSLIEEHQYTLNIYMVDQRGKKSKHFDGGFGENSQETLWIPCVASLPLEWLGLKFFPCETPHTEAQQPINPDLVK